MSFRLWEQNRRFRFEQVLLPKLFLSRCHSPEHSEWLNQGAVEARFEMVNFPGQQSRETVFRVTDCRVDSERTAARSDPRQGWMVVSVFEGAECSMRA